ncbi:MAG: ABC transporter ATP-binding protein, partial [Candidatus Hydrogenedentes bacterium]|nr:ABC transporter ATP-binding protein [Candidatus Hydrogenedentota bacterium]
MLLELRDVRTHFPVYSGLVRRKQVGTVKAVDGVSFSVSQGETLGLVGESGCGKSTLARTILRLVKPTSGAILLDGHDLARMSPRELRGVRPGMQMIFQDPYASLNPRMTVQDAIAEPLMVHKAVPPRDVANRVGELMELVGLSRKILRKYPHEFSGGQRQRIAFARSLALNPKLLIADEPVSALDVSVQAQILNLLDELRRRMNLAMVFISHDLSVVKHVASRIAVMYLGKIVEMGDAGRIMAQPAHPYTRALRSAVPVADPQIERQRRRILLPGDPPSPLNPPHGCAFHPRCAYVQAECKEAVPAYAAVSGAPDEPAKVHAACV